MAILPAAQNSFAPPPNPLLAAFQQFRSRFQQPQATAAPEADRGMTPDMIARQRAVAEAMLERGTSTAPVGHWTQGAARVVDAIVGARNNRLAGEAEMANAEASRGVIEALLGGAMPGTTAPFAAGGASAGFTAPPRDPMAPQAIADDTMAALGHEPMADVTIRDGIAATAQALGIDPVDLATAISYETAGTFDPTKAGPTTKWGQHRGLIQFGEPQAQQYGVNWDDPVNSQLGPDGAVAKYLRDAGVQPGMGLLDIYSAINAGGVGLYDRSDAAAGGAPGTVRDKVERQMADHRRRAAGLFGADAGGVQVAQAGPARDAFITALTDPRMSPEARSVATALLQQQMQQQAQANDPMRAMQLERAQLELEALRNPRLSPSDQLARERFEFEQQQAETTTGIKDYNAYSADERAAGRVPLGRLEYERATRSAGATNITNVLGGESLTPGQKKIDEAFADTYLDWVGGGYADTAKQIEQLNEAIGIIGSGENISGAIGALPRGMQAFVNPNGTIARELVEEVVQRSLREILGAQFTEREGERLIARAYNPLLDPEENRKRVQRLMTQISGMAEARQAMVDHFDENGTMRGYKGARPRPSDLNDLMATDEEIGAAQAAGPAGVADSAMPPPPDGFSPEDWQRTWSVMTPEERALFQ